MADQFSKFEEKVAKSLEVLFLCAFFGGFVFMCIERDLNPLLGLFALPLVLPILVIVSFPLWVLPCGLIYAILPERWRNWLFGRLFDFVWAMLNVFSRDHVVADK